MAKVKCCDLECTTFIWKIKYPFLFTDCNVCSPSFSLDSCGVTRYYLNFVSKKRDEGIYNVSLYLKKHEWDCDPGTVILNFKISITGYQLDENYSLDHVNFLRNSETIFQDEISIMNVGDYTTKSDIKFNIDIEPDMNFEEMENFWTCNYEDLESLSSDITRLLRTKQFSDLTFRSIDGKPVRLHRTIFASRYSTLANSLDLLNNPKQEYNLGIDMEGISVLLNYLYSGKINIEDSKFGLLELLNRAPLYHFQHILFSEPRIVHASTSVPLKYGSFIWIIPKFSEIKNDTYIVNCLCCDNLLAWTRLRILLYIRENAHDERCIAFKIQRMGQNGKLLALCKMSILGEEDYSETFQLFFESQRELVIPSFIRVRQIEERENSFLTNDTLRLRFEVTLSNLEEVSEYDSVRCLEVERGQFPSISMNLWAFRKDMGHLYLNSAFSDITIKTGELLIPAHKVVLSARSPVFCRNLENGVENSTIIINNYDTDTVVNILSYIYCGTVNSESKSFEWAINLYEAANEYHLIQLKYKCTQFIETLLSPNNISRVLELADECNDSSLQECAHTFIIAHFYEVLQSNEWIGLMNEKPYLTTPIVKEYLN